MNDVINKVIELKEKAVKNQDYEFAGKMRDIENSFTKSKHAQIHLEPTIINLEIELNKVLKYFEKYNHCKESVRDLKIKLLLNEL